MRTLRISLAVVDSLISKMESIRNHIDSITWCGNIDDDIFDSQSIIESMEYTIDKAKYDNTLGDVYIADMISNIVFTYDDSANPFADIRNSQLPSLWYNAACREHGWNDSSNALGYLKNIRSVLRGNTRRWTHGNQMSTRNLYFANTSMYILSRYRQDVEDIISRVETLESM